MSNLIPPTGTCQLCLQSVSGGNCTWRPQPGSRRCNFCIRHHQPCKINGISAVDLWTLAPAPTALAAALAPAVPMVPPLASSVPPPPPPSQPQPPLPTPQTFNLDNSTASMESTEQANDRFRFDRSDSEDESMEPANDRFRFDRSDSEEDDEDMELEDPDNFDLFEDVPAARAAVHPEEARPSWAQPLDSFLPPYVDAIGKTEKLTKLELGFRKYELTVWDEEDEDEEENEAEGRNQVDIDEAVKSFKSMDISGYQYAIPSTGAPSSQSAVDKDVEDLEPTYRSASQTTSSIIGSSQSSAGKCDNDVGTSSRSTPQPSSQSLPSTAHLHATVEDAEEDDDNLPADEGNSRATDPEPRCRRLMCCKEVVPLITEERRLNFNQAWAAETFFTYMLGHEKPIEVYDAGKKDYKYWYRRKHQWIFCILDPTLPHDEAMGPKFNDQTRFFTLNLARDKDDNVKRFELVEIIDTNPLIMVADHWDNKPDEYFLRRGGTTVRCPHHPHSWYVVMNIDYFNFLDDNDDDDEEDNFAIYSDEED